MRNSVIATPSITLEQQAIKDSPDLVVGRIVPELCHGQRISSGCQLVDLVVAGKLKSDLHSMHRHCAVIVQAALTVPYQARKYAKDVIVARHVKVSVGQVYGLFKKLFMVHAVIIGYFRICGHSYFPRGLT